MSHFSVIRTKITNTEHLMKALQDLGFESHMVQCNEKAVNLYGYQGDKREQTAEVVIPRQYISSLSNDIGFKQQADGTYEAIISDYDRKNYSQQWLDKLSQRYSYNYLQEEIKQNGFFIEEEYEEDGEIILECTVYE